MLVSDATFVVFDVESTGLDPTEDRIVEAAAVALRLDGIVGMWASLVNPGIRIPPEVSAVHGLTDRDVADADPWERVLPRLHAFVKPYSPIVKCSHNWAFDSRFLRTRDGLCTERLARHLWKDAPNYKLGTLRYWRGLEVEMFGIPSHRALGDTLVAAELLLELLGCKELPFEIGDIDALLAFSAAPIIHTHWPFGKYGPKNPDGAQLIDMRDPGYIDWCLTKMEDLSPDMRYTLERCLKGAA